MRTFGPRELIVGAGGVLLIVSLFLPWAGAGPIDRSGWELLAMADIYLLIAGVLAIAAAITGGHYGVFRPDVSLIGAADILSVVGTVMLAWFVFFDFPEGADRQIGAFLALLSAIAVAGGAGDYEAARTGNLFARTR